MVKEATGQLSAKQLHEIKTEVRRLRGLSKFTTRLIINEAKSRGIDLVQAILAEFSEPRAKAYLLVDGFKTSTEIGNLLGISQQAAHQHLQKLIQGGYVNCENPHSPKTVFKKTEVEDALGLSRLLIRKFDLAEWLRSLR